MAEYIKKDAAISALQLTCLYDSDKQEAVMNFAFNHCREKIAAIPAAEVAPVAHAQWTITRDKWGRRALVCSHCKKHSGLLAKKPYCPICGAKMDRE